VKKVVQAFLLNLANQVSRTWRLGGLSILLELVIVFKEHIEAIDFGLEMPV
jgi:hypothetical protein